MEKNIRLNKPKLPLSTGRLCQNSKQRHEKNSRRTWRLAWSCHSAWVDCATPWYSSTSSVQGKWHKLSMVWVIRHGQPVPLSYMLHFPYFLGNFCDISTRPCFMVIPWCPRKIDPLLNNEVKNMKYWTKGAN